MKGCFGMKSKKQKPSKKCPALAERHQFERSEGNRYPPNHMLTTRASLEHSVSQSSGVVKLPPGTKLPSGQEGTSKRKTLSECAEDGNSLPVTPTKKFAMTTTAKNDLDSRTNTISYEFEKSISIGTRNLLTKPKLPPIPKSSSSHVPGRCGLKNIGNTCYMNSAIQCLSSIPGIREWAMRQHPSLSEKNIIDVYASLVKLMWSGDHECVRPGELKRCVSYSAPIFANYGQKDCHEFMNSLLNALQNVDSTSFFINLFQIHTQSKVTCNTCQYPDITDETTTFLPLPIPQLQSHDNTKVLLEDLIKDFCQESVLDGQYYCQKCNSCQFARQKTIIIQPLPHVLIIQLKRFPFDQTNRKIDTLIQYKLEHHNLFSDHDRYDLCAVSMHSGSLAGGHYTTMARNYINNKWYRFDDSFIEEIKSDRVLVPLNARQAYVLVYLKYNE